MSRTARFALLASLVILGAVAVWSCRNRDEAPPPDAVAVAPGDGTQAIDPATLRPRIAPNGRASRLPDQVIIDLARVVDVVVAEEGRLADGTVVSIDPEIEGDLAISSPTTLTFTPTTGFAPETTYRVTLESLETSAGIVRPPAENGWSAEFTTTSFRLDGALLTDFQAETGEGVVELRFTGPVQPSEVASRAVFTLHRKGQPDAPVPMRFEPSQDTNVVLARIASKGLRPGDELALALRKGVKLSQPAGHAAPAATASVTLVDSPAAPEVTIEDAYPAEATNGFVVEIVCDDASVSDRRWYWDPSTDRGFGELSARCALDAEDLAEKLSFDPPVKFTTALSGGGVRVFGDFVRGTYALRLEPGVRTRDGGRVRQSFETTLTVPARKPKLSFVAKGRYLPRDQWRSLPFRHVNVDAVDVVVRHVREESLLFWASGEGEATTNRDSDVLAKTRLALKSEQDALTTSWIDVGSLVPSATRGLLEITLTSDGASDTARLVLTDLQLVAKRETGPKPSNQGGTVRAWVFESETLAPARGVVVDLVRPSGQVVVSATTDGSGAAVLAVRTPEIEQEPPFALVARRAGDLTYLAFDEVETDVADAAVGGEPWSSDTKWRAALFTDRGVYRPGETARAVGIVRGADYGPAPAAMPVVLRLVDPRGQILRESAVPVSATGVVTLDLDFADFATTGRHELQLDVGDARVATHRFHVEEFVPERMRVEAAAKAPAALVGETLTVAATARYLFGGVPADHRAELTCTAETGAFTPRENANFQYGTWREEGTSTRSVTLGTASGVLDAEGRVELQCPTGAEGSLTGPGRIVANVAVFESGSGRTTVGQALVPLHPERHYVGLSTRATTAKGGEAIAIEGVVVDWDGKLASGVAAVTLELVRLEQEYGWTYDEERGHSTYRSYLRSTPEGETTAKVSGGKFQATLTPSADAWGYLVRASAGRARTELHVDGTWSDGWWDEWNGEQSVDRTPRPGKPAWLPIDGPATVQVGEATEVTLKAPHRGRLLFTVEAEGVIAQEWKDVEAGPVSWRFRIPEFRPNVYVTALLVKPPHLESEEAFLPDRAYGVASIPVEPARFRQAVKLTVPKEIRSHAPLHVDVDLGPLDSPAQVVVAAVDEGILSLTKFKSPDPISQIFARRALGVQTFETIGWSLLSSPPPPKGLGSGDEALALGRVQSIKPVALWSGLLDVPKSGKLRVTLDVPTYRGELRVMAVAVTPQRMGSASAAVVVRDPLTLQVTLPRFFNEGDVAQVPVFVTNVSGARRNVDITLTSEDLDVGGPAAASEPRIVSVSGGVKALDLAEGESGTTLFTVRVKGRGGAARLVARARSGDLVSEDTVDVPVTASGPRSRIVKRLELEQGRTVLTSHLAGWEPLSERTTVWVTSNPYADTFDHLKHLIRYPYGCIEQTTSTTRPLLVMQHVVSDVDPKLVAQGGIESMVKAGIERILSMQTPSGGFSYWPGGREEAYWGTAYATHLLVDAQERSYPVPRERLDAALAWMEDRITNHYERGRSNGDWYSEDAEPYMHFVLARAGRARAARIESLLGQVPGQSEGERAENRFLLQAALWLGGDRRFEKELRATDTTPLSDERRNGWSFYSDRRRRGMMLSVHVDLFGADASGEKLANLVAEGLRAHPSPHYTTQELVWSITGLGKFVGATASFAPPSLAADGREMTPAPRRPGASESERSWSVTRASEYGEVVLDVPEKGEGRLFAVISSEGVRTGAVPKLGGEGLALTRSFVDGSGAPIDPATGVSLGDVVNVVLSVANRTSERIANVAVVARVPAGWEIENPRLGRQSALDWLPEDTVWDASHMDVRDDRVEVFGHLESGQERKIAFAARAVTSGRFTLPSAEAEAMYDPTVWARTPGEPVLVNGPWAPVAQ